MFVLIIYNYYFYFTTKQLPYKITFQVLFHVGNAIICHFAFYQSFKDFTSDE